MNVFSVPLAPATPQRLSVPLGDTRYTLRLRWNNALDLWVMDISAPSGVKLASGIAVVSGADLVNQLTYLGFTGALIAQNSTDPNAPPSFDGLGVTDRLFYVPYGQPDQIPFVRPAVSDSSSAMLGHRIGGDIVGLEEGGALLLEEGGFIAIEEGT